MASFTSAPERDLGAGLVAEAFGKRVGELEDRAGTGAAQRLVERGDEPVRSHLVEEVARGEGVDRLAVDRGAEVHRRVAAVDEGVVAVREIGEAVAELVDLMVDGFVVDRGEVELHPQALVARELHDGAGLDDRVELDGTRLLARGDLDLGRGDHVEVLAHHGVGVEARQPVLERLLPADLGTEAGLEQAARGLAGPEPGDAHLVGELAERGIDRRFELGLRDRDVELDPVGFERDD